MLYNIDFELGALFFLIVVMIHFFRKYKIPTVANRLFGLISIATIVNIAADIGSTLALSNPHEAPLWATYAVTMLYYILQTLLPAMMYAYILCITKGNTKMNKGLFAVTMLPFAIVEIIIITSPATKLFFSIDQDGVLARGITFQILYESLFFYMILTLLCAIIYRKELPKVQSVSIFIFLGMIAAAIVVQFFFPEYLLTNLGVSLAVVMMYLTLQNPDEMLDDASGALNRSSFIKHVEEEYHKGQDFYITAFLITNMKSLDQLFGLKLLNKALHNFVKEIKTNTKNSHIFRISTGSFLMTSRNDEECKMNSQVMYDVLERGFRVNGNDMTIITYRCVVPGIKFENPTIEVLPLVEGLLEKAQREEIKYPIYAEDDDMKALARQFELEKGLSYAIKSNKIEVVFQPIYSVKDRRFTRAEALARYTDPKLGVISPAEFIPVAEKLGLVSELGRQIQKKACKFIRDFELDKCETFDAIEVNLSSAEIMQPNMDDNLIFTMENFQVKPENLVLEVTEDVASAMRTDTIDVMESLMREGVRFALDDFGTGYSNISSVVRMPFEIIKIDRSMVAGSFEDKNTAIVFNQLLNMIQYMNKEIIVEGVETTEQAETMLKHGIEYIQGFYYSRPVSAEECARLLINDYRHDG